MSERNGYEPGVPCWVDLSTPDVAPVGPLLGRFAVVADPWSAVFAVIRLTVPA
jgi:hypothetical protein